MIEESFLIWNVVLHVPVHVHVPIHLHVHVPIYMYMYLYLYMYKCNCTTSFVSNYIIIKTTVSIPFSVLHPFRSTPDPEQSPLPPGEGPDGGARRAVGGGPRVSADHHGPLDGKENRFEETDWSCLCAQSCRVITHMPRLHSPAFLAPCSV